MDTYTHTRSFARAILQMAMPSRLAHFSKSLVPPPVSLPKRGGYSARALKRRSQAKLSNKRPAWITEQNFRGAEPKQIVFRRYRVSP